MEYLDEAALEITIDSDVDLGVIFFTESIPGARVMQPLFRSMPDLSQAHEVFLLVKEAAEAVGAVGAAVKILRALRNKHPDVARKTSLRVRAGAKVKREALDELWELGFSVDYTQEPTETFSAGPKAPSRAGQPSDK